jgi:hypothetical protein
MVEMVFFSKASLLTGVDFGQHRGTTNAGYIERSTIVRVRCWSRVFVVSKSSNWCHRSDI